MFGMDILSALVGGGLQGYGAKKYFDTSRKGEDYGGRARIAGRMEELANAQANPDSPMFQKLYQQNKSMGSQDLARTIAEIQRQNRKAVSMGRSPLLDQERGGESVFRNLMQGELDNDRTARSDTFGQLDDARRALAPSYEAFGDIAAGQYKNKRREAGAYSTLGDSLKALFGLNNNRRYSGESSYYPASGTTAEWYAR